VSQLSASLPRLIVEYDDDPAGAADALLAMLSQPQAAIEPRDDEEEATEAAA
jgi:hypothetical protein